MTTSPILIDLSELRDSAEDAQTFSRLALEETDSEKRREWQRKARHAMGVVRARTKAVDAEIGGWNG